MAKNKPLAEILRSERERQGYSVSDVANETGLSQSALNKFFTGQRDGVRLGVADVLLDFLDVSVKPNKKAKKK